MARQVRCVHCCLSCGIAALCCCAGFLLWFFWNPFERIGEPQALATVDLTNSRQPYRHHATGRDEFVFLHNSIIEVYRLGPDLARLRSVPVEIEGSTDSDHISAFPNSPRAVLYRDTPNLSIVNTENGKVERSIALPDTVGDVVISQDERWLALKLHESQILSRDPKTGKPIYIQKGSRALTVVDLMSGELVELIEPQSPKATPDAMAFAGANSLFVSCSSPYSFQFWDLPTRRCLWTAAKDEKLYHGSAVVASNSRVLVGYGDRCELWDTEKGSVVCSHSASRGAMAVAINPKNGDCLAGYSRPNFTLFAGLAGAVRVWNAEGERIVTFAAHRDKRWQEIGWMAVSRSGKYLVTAEFQLSSGAQTTKLWDYAVVTGRSPQ
jgi:WD40 repeat protein